MKLLVSACLLGDPVRYDGKSKRAEGIEELSRYHEVFKICPEVSGELPVPREPAEIKGCALNILRKEQGGIFTLSGLDVSENFRLGAQNTLKLCREHGIQAAVLKERSPSCGLNQVYDGTHSGRVIPGSGLTAALLLESGIKIYTEDNFRELIPDP